MRPREARTVSLYTTAIGDTGNATQLIGGFKGVLTSPKWSPDGSSIALLATENAHKEIGATQPGAAIVGDIGATQAQDVQRIALYSLGVMKFVSPPDLFVYEYDWRADGGFVGTAAHGNGDNNWWIAKLYAFDPGATFAREIASPKMQMMNPRVSPDGKTVAFIGGIMSDFGSTGGDIYTVPVAGGTPVDVTPQLAASATSLHVDRRAWQDHVYRTRRRKDGDRNGRPRDETHRVAVERRRIARLRRRCADRLRERPPNGRDGVAIV